MFNFTKSMIKIVDYKKETRGLSQVFFLRTLIPTNLFQISYKSRKKWMPKFSHGFLKALLRRVVCWVPCSSSWVSLSGRSVECFMFCGFARAAKLSPERSLSISTSTSAALSCSRGPSSPSVSCRQWSQLCGSLWKKITMWVTNGACPWKKT